MAHGSDVLVPERAAPPPAGAADRAVALVNDVVVKLSSVALVVSGFALTYSVIVRYFLKISTDWQDEMTVFLIVGAVFMSSAAVQALRGHVAIEAVSSLLSPSVNHVRLIVVDIMSLAFCTVFSWKAWTLL